MKYKLIIIICLFQIGYPQVKSQVVDSLKALKKDIIHMHWRLPEWIWKNKESNAFITDLQKKEIEEKITVWSKWDAENNPRADSLERIIARDIGNKFALIDITREGRNFVNLKNDFNLSVVLDPSFNAGVSKTIYQAVGLYLDIALDKDVLTEAFDSSTDAPTPQAKIYQIDSATGKQIYTEEYKEDLMWRVKPLSQKTFREQLKNALTTANGDPALLVITLGNKPPWWGWSYMNYFYDPNQTLARLSPGHNYLFVEFNIDSLETNRSTEFWASKVAHEIMHNLGYLHPVYKNPRERDENNMGKNKAFIVAYERAILKKARELLIK